MKPNSVRLALLPVLLAVGLWAAVGAAASDDESLPKDVPSLVKLLRDKDPKVRGRAANHLCALRGKAAAAVPELVLLLGDDEVAEPMAMANGRVCDAASWALLAIGRPAVDELIKALVNGNVRIRERAITALGYMEPPPKQAVPALARLLRDSSADVRRHAARTLGRIGKGAGDAVAPLLELSSHDPDLWVRTEATGAAAAIDSDGQRAIPVCAQALNDKDPNVRGQAARALGNYGVRAESAVAALTAGLADQGERAQPMGPPDMCGQRAVRFDMAEALGKIGRGAAPALPKLRKLYQADEDDETRAAAALAVLRIDAADKGALPALISLAPDLEPALEALENLGPRATPAIPAVKKALRNQDGVVRGAAVAALAAIAKKEAVPVLTALWQEARRKHRSDSGGDYFAYPLDRWDIAEALGKLGADAAAAVPALSEMLDDPRSDGADRLVVEELLGKIGPAAKPAVPRLLKIMNSDPEEDVRAAARAALQQIAPEALPPRAKGG